jgi:hypothetical protein
MTPCGERGGDDEAAADGERDPRTHGAWRVWLAALATDAEAALSAALTYESLEAAGRDAWLDALDADAPAVGGPALALYAPLLAVEDDPARCARIDRAIHGDEESRFLLATPHAGGPRALRGTLARVSSTSDVDVVVAIVVPLYLGFAELLICRFDPDRGVVSATHEPLCAADSLAPGSVCEGATLDRAVLDDVIEELAHAIVADRRAGRAAPDALVHFADLFTPG